jgi:hypothetical protein
MKTLQLMGVGGWGGDIPLGFIIRQLYGPLCHTIWQTPQSIEEGRGQIVFVLTVLKDGCASSIRPRPTCDLDPRPVLWLRCRKSGIFDALHCPVRCEKPRVVSSKGRSIQEHLFRDISVRDTSSWRPYVGLLALVYNPLSTPVELPSADTNTWEPSSGSLSRDAKPLSPCFSMGSILFACSAKLSMLTYNTARKDKITKIRYVEQQRTRKAKKNTFFAVVGIGSISIVHMLPVLLLTTPPNYKVIFSSLICMYMCIVLCLPFSGSWIAFIFS